MSPWSTESVYPRLLEHFNEKQRRLYVASEALRIGFGGVSKVSRESGISRVTITAGVAELRAGIRPSERIRAPGGGRKPLTTAQPGIDAAVEQVANPKGDPMSPIRWTSHSLEHIATAAKGLGHSVSPMSVHRILKAKGFALRANKKEVEDRQHPDRNAQFEISKGLTFNR